MEIALFLICDATCIRVPRQVEALTLQDLARVFARLLGAFFERSRFTAQIGENFASEMQ